MNGMLLNLGLSMRAAVAALFSAAVGVSPAAMAANLVVDAETGQVIVSDAPNHVWYPASLAKLMTVYVAFSEIAAGRLRFEDTIKVSRYAAEQMPVDIGLRSGQLITVRQAIDAAIVASANDAAIALAEKIAGSEEAFALRMTDAARELGMSRTVFYNASGLPDLRQVTTARDMAVLAMALIQQYPEHYPLFNQRSITIGTRSHYSVNTILGAYEGADGLKTGFTCASGYNLVASVQRDRRRIIGVVLGSTTRQSRNAEMIRILTRAFEAAPSAGLTLAMLDKQSITDGDETPPIILAEGACDTQLLANKEVAAPRLITSAAELSGWAVILGTFAQQGKAEAVVREAQAQLGDAKSGAPAVIKKQFNGAARYSGMLVGMDQATAGRMCNALWKRSAYCLPLSPQLLRTRYADIK